MVGEITVTTTTLERRGKKVAGEERKLKETAEHLWSKDCLADYTTVQYPQMLNPMPFKCIEDSSGHAVTCVLQM